MVFPTRFPPPSIPRAPPGQQQPPVKQKGLQDIETREEYEADAIERLEERLSKMRGKSVRWSTLRRVRVRTDMEQEMVRPGSSRRVRVHRDPVPGQEPLPPNPDNSRPHASLDSFFDERSNAHYAG